MRCESITDTTSQGSRVGVLVSVLAVLVLAVLVEPTRAARSAVRSLRFAWTTAERGIQPAGPAPPADATVGLVAVRAREGPPFLPAQP